MKTFVLIMGAGRCGSTSLISFLNKKENFNIYGENNAIIYETLNNISKIEQIKKTKSEELDRKYCNFIYKNRDHIGVEWYNPRHKIENLQSSLTQSVLDYFDNKENYVGFKEVRWKNKKLDCLNILEKYFTVKYVFLTRNINDQVKSIEKLNWGLIEPIYQHVTKTNKSIKTFLETKSKTQYLIKNITTDKNFLNEIYEFLVADAKKKSS